MGRKEKRLLFILGVVLFIGLPIYYYLPRLVVYTANVIYLIMVLVGAVILVKLLGDLWRRL